MITWLDKPWVEQIVEPEIKHVSSREGVEIQAIFLHYTAGGHYLRSTHAWWTSPEAKCSAHFIIGREGQVAQCVPLNLRAWHAGKAFFPVKTPHFESPVLSSSPDRGAIGIEIANFGKLQNSDGVFFFELGSTLGKYRPEVYGTPEFAKSRWFQGGAYWEPYKPEQVKAIVRLCACLVSEFKIPLWNIVGHEDIADPPGRKLDPGPLWDWDSFYKELAHALGIPVPERVKRNLR